jgi:LacI family transcriptional regulator
MSKRVTLDTIATATKLSKYAVSRAISGKSGISDETRQKVLDCCQAMGYRKKTAYNGDTYRVMLLFIPRADVQDASFWMEVLQGIESTASKYGYALHVKFVQSSQEMPQVELENSSGIIYAGYKSLETMMQYRHLGKPAILMTYPPEKLLYMDTIHMADEEAGYVLFEKLYEWGHRCIGFWGDMERPSSRHRFAGVVQAATEYGVILSRIWNSEKYQNQVFLEEELRGLKSANKLPTAILCSHDHLALKLIMILENMELSVPSDISVTGFNSDTSEKSHTSVTSIGYSKREYGELAVQYLYERIVNPNLPFKRIALVPTLLLKGSAGPIGKT